MLSDTSHPPVPQANWELRLSKAVIMVVQGIGFGDGVGGTLIQILPAVCLFSTLNLI